MSKPGIVTTAKRNSTRGKPVVAMLTGILAIVAVAILLYNHKKQTKVGNVSMFPQHEVNVTNVATDAAPTQAKEPAPKNETVATVNPAGKALATPTTWLSLANTGRIVRAQTPSTGIIVNESNVVERTQMGFGNDVESFIYRFANRAKHPVMLFTRFGGDAETEQQLKKILETDIVIYEDESEETQRLKEGIAGIKQQILKAVDEGKSASEILLDMRDENNRLIIERTQMQRVLNSLVKSNMVEQATEYFNTANVKLSDDMLPPLVFDASKLPEEKE